MSQPSFVPHEPVSNARIASKLSPPRQWSGNRPGELTPAAPVEGAGLGSPGPNQGYALRLAHRLEHDYVLTAREHRHDVSVGAALLAAKRSALFGRAPSIYDVRLALAIFGYFDHVGPELVEYRMSLFSSVSHDYFAQRRLVDSVPDATLRLSPDAAAGLEWREALGLISHEATEEMSS